MSYWLHVVGGARPSQVGSIPTESGPRPKQVELRRCEDLRSRCGAGWVAQLDWLPSYAHLIARGRDAGAWSGRCGFVSPATCAATPHFLLQFRHLVYRRHLPRPQRPSYHEGSAGYLD